MSTPAIILKAIKDNKLVEFIPKMKGRELPERGLFLTPALNKWVLQEPKKNPSMQYHADVYADLKVFVIGEEIDDCNFMKQSRPFIDDIWAIRILFRPQCRIFGAFLCKDCFIGLHKAERKNLDYDKHVKRAKDEWQDLFPGTLRLSGTRFSHYVSNGMERDHDRKKYN